MVCADTFRLASIAIQATPPTASATTITPNQRTYPRETVVSTKKIVATATKLFVDNRSRIFPSTFGEEFECKIITLILHSLGLMRGSTWPHRNTRYSAN